MKSEAIADDARRRDDDAVRRLRDESGRRIARQRSIGMSRCMLGAMLSMLFFVTLEARREYCIAAVVGAQEDAALACATFERRRTEIEGVKGELLASAFDAEEIRRIDERMNAALEVARRFALEKGCEAAAPPPPVPPPRRQHCFTKWGIEPYGGGSSTECVYVD